MKSTIDIDDPELLALPETALALEVVDLVKRSASPALRITAFAATSLRG